MHIIATYFLEGAPDFVPLSSESLDAILMSKASSTSIFRKAREEMMDKLRGSRGTPVRTIKSGTGVCSFYTYVGMLCCLLVFVVFAFSGLLVESVGKKKRLLFGPYHIYICDLLRKSENESESGGREKFPWIAIRRILGDYTQDYSYRRAGYPYAP